MKILIFEYITASSEMSESLQREGQMMLDALQANFEKLADIEVIIAIKEHFQNQLKTVDAAWIIAPEFDEILQYFCELVENENKILLTSPSKVVAQTANKLTTFDMLTAAKIQTVPTEIFDSAKRYDKTREWIIKPIDGAGAENTFLLQAENDWSALPSVEKTFLIQPHIQGEKVSLSCIFKNGQAQLLCVNLQVFEMKKRQFELKNIAVNFKQDDGRYQKLASQIASAFPDLLGYVGIDVIENETGCFVLEINPRLTTSFVQIEEKIGVNVAKLVIDCALGQTPFAPFQQTNSPPKPAQT
ncbi:MAG: ATP-grasp domain-containing protein [Methylococcales bacterium]|nr:ATP-grasp domain-containing protein [Methylococcales bacterium]